MDYAAKFEQIDALVAAQANPQLDCCLRDVEEQRLVAQLYADYDEMSEAEQEALGDAHQAWIDARDDRATVELADAGVELVAASHPDHLEHIADVWPDQDSRTVRGLREQARIRRSRINATAPVNGSALVTAPTRTAPRARARRERHVARSTSSGDSGASGESDLPGLARPGRAVRRSCERCGRTDGETEIQFSVASGAWVCLDCHCLAGATAADPPSPVAPCPDCSEPRGARYKHNGRLVCWPCTGLAPLPPPRVNRADFQTFRFQIIDALNRIDASRFAYIDANRLVHVCPVCRADDGWLAVHFIGKTCRVDLTCSWGCLPVDIAHALNLKEHP